jgi:F-type H+-transporting ATPase subunit b
VILLKVIGILSIAVTAYAAGGGQGTAPSLFSLNFLFRIINFVILFGGLGYFLAKPLKNYIKSRSIAVRDAIAEAKKAKEDAQTKAIYYETKLSQLEKEVSHMMETFKKEAEEERGRIVRDAKEQIEKTKERMLKSLEQERIRIRQEVMMETSVMAVKLAEEILKKNFAVADQKKMVQEYIKMMERIN